MFSRRIRNLNKPRRRLTFTEAVGGSAEAESENVSMDERDQVMREAGDGEGTPAGVQPLSRSSHTDCNSANRLLSTEFPTRPYGHISNSGPDTYVSMTEGYKSNVAGEREGTPADVQPWRRPPHTDYNSHRTPFTEYTNGPSYNHHPTPGQPGDVVINDKANLIPPPIYNPRFFDYVGSTMIKLPNGFRYFSTESLLQTAGKGREGRNYFCRKVREVIKKYELSTLESVKFENFDGAVHEMLIWCPALCFADGITAIKKAIWGSMRNCWNKSKTRREKASGTYVKGQYKRGGERRQSFTVL